MAKEANTYLSLVGEVATKDVAERMIQFSRMAVAPTIFAYHAKPEEEFISGSNKTVSSEQ